MSASTRTRCQPICNVVNIEEYVKCHHRHHARARSADWFAPRRAAQLLHCLKRLYARCAHAICGGDVSPHRECGAH